MGRASITVSCRCRGVGVDIIAGPAGWSGSDGAARLAPVPAAHGGLLPRVAVRGRARLAPVPAAHGGLLPSLRRVIGKRNVTWSADAVAYSDKTSQCWRYLSTGVCRHSADVVSGRRKGGSAVIRPAKNAPWLPLAALRRRPLPALPAGLAGYLVALVGLATGLAAVGLSTTPVRVVHLVTWAALVGAGVVCMELTRAAGQPAGLSRDLLSAWKIPVALLLPPVYALVTATLFVTLQQRRVRPGLMHRRVLSAAALGLADGAASLLFHWLLPPQTSPASWFVHRPLAALGAGVLCGLVG